MSALERLARFAAVGVVGFLVDGAVLELARAWLGWGNLAARAPSFIAAVLTTWLLNRRLAFGRTGAAGAGALLSEFGRYFTVSLGGNFVNIAVYVALALTLFARYPLAALAAASLAGMLVNFIGYSRWVYGVGRDSVSRAPEPSARPPERIP